jgi:hypothetical protein
MALFGRRDITIEKVQAGLLRAAFLKSIAYVVEAWHTLGSTIRDAQEIGIHRTGLVECAVVEGSPDGLVGGSREPKARAKLWLSLHLWDAHMGVVLGRPMSTRLNPQPYIAWYEYLRINDDGNQCHKPFDLMLSGYAIGYRYLEVISNMGETDLNREQYNEVEKMHHSIIKQFQHSPEWAKGGTASGSNDHARCCAWLPAAQETLITEISFVVLALHRPYIFSVTNSRSEALKAAIAMLESQHRLFSMTEPRQYMAFNLVFATLDALVLIITIYLFFPLENETYYASCVHNIEWGIARLDEMRKHNKLASSAFDVVQVLYRKLSRQSHTPEAQALAANGHARVPLENERMASKNALETMFSSVQPPRPLHDLVTSAGAGSDMLSEQEQFVQLESQGWLTDEFWQLINQLPE